MRQVNIVGISPPSQPSRKIQTLPAPPDMAPANVTLRTASETSLWLRWMVSRNLCLPSLTYPSHFLLVVLHNQKRHQSKEPGLFRPTFSLHPLCSAFAWVGVQRERRAGGLQGSVLPRGLTGPSTDTRHCWPSGERVYHRGPGRVDGVRGQGPGRQRHRDGALEPACQRQDKGVWWVSTLSAIHSEKHRFSAVWRSDDRWSLALLA